MSTQSEVMHCYEQIAPLTEQMLALARSSEWGGLPALEARFSDMVAHVRFLEGPQGPGRTLDEPQRARKLQLLHRIHANHAALCGLVMPQLAHLSQVIRRLEQQDQLRRTYEEGGRPLQ